MMLQLPIGLTKNQIFNSLNEKFFGNKIDELRYGENPHQKSSIYYTDQKN